MKKELLTLRNEQLRLEKDMDHLQETEQDWLDLFEYGNLLDLPVTLSQFIPCKDGKPLEKPNNWELIQEQGLRSSIIDTMSSDELQAIEAYRTALDAVIFEGGEWSKENPWIECENWRIRFSTDRIFLDRNVGDNQFVGTVLNNPSISDLAQATIENPLKMKSK